MTSKHTETLGVDGLNPLSAEQPAGTSPAEQEVKFRTGMVSLLAAGIGMIAGVIAYLLYNLIGLFTNIFFYHRISFAFVSARNNHLGLLVIVTPVIGGLIVGILARYGSDKIRGHGIPEAMEAVLINRSRIEPKVAILKPISAAIAIGTGGPFGAEGPIIQTGGAIGSLVGQLDAYHRSRAQSSAGQRRCRRHGRNLQHSDCRSDPGHRATALRVQVALLHSPRDRQHSGHQRPLSVDGVGTNV